MNAGFSSRPQGAVIWFTGLSGSGKSTIADALCAEMASRGMDVERLDGDAMRALFPAGFTREARNEHIRRVGYMASRLAAHGVHVVASFISPYAESRDFVRGLCGLFIEVYLSTPLAECERRDVKGLYARARRGELRNFTGLDDPYEPPSAPELSIDTRTESVAAAVDRILGAVGARARGGQRRPAGNAAGRGAGDDACTR